MTNALRKDGNYTDKTFSVVVLSVWECTYTYSI